jgi:hypothetical protein
MPLAKDKTLRFPAHPRYIQFPDRWLILPHLVLQGRMKLSSAPLTGKDLFSRQAIYIKSV